jgi:excisionase family DNA binding protein
LVEDLYTIEEAARKLRVCRTLAFRLLRDGKLAYVRIGADRRIPESAIAEYIRKNTISADARAIPTAKSAVKRKP